MCLFPALLAMAILAPPRTLAKDKEPQTFNLRDADHPDAVAAARLDLIRRYPAHNNSSNDGKEYFRLLELDGDHLLIGAADAVHNVSLRIFERAGIYRWAPGEAERAECTMKSMDQALCRNFVRVLSRLGAGTDARLLVCGTNAFAPACRVLRATDYEVLREFPALGIAPFDPAQNSTYLMGADGDLIYSATVADFAGADALIFRRNVSAPDDAGTLRTQRGNALMLDRPQFVGTMQTEEHVYFFFHERAAEAAAEFQPGSYSRVARVCKRDPGGPRPAYAAEWSSFVKARLNCSIPERNRPFYFDELIAVSNPVPATTTRHGSNSSDSDPDLLVYATFVSEFNFLRHSVICAFRIGQIDSLFRHGPHLAYDPVQRRWARRERDELTASLGQCPPSVNKTKRDQKVISEDEAIAMRRYPLMADAVPNAFPAGAVGIHRGADHYNQIVVLPGVEHMDSDKNGPVDVLYVATDQGNLLKLFNPLALHSVAGNSSSVVLSGGDPLRQVALLHVAQQPIRRLLISSASTSAAPSFLVVVTDQRVYRLRLHWCELYAGSCARCVGARDPHCAWHAGRCRAWDEIKAEGWRAGQQEPVQDVLGRKGDVQKQCKGRDPVPDTAQGGGSKTAGTGDAKKGCKCPAGKPDCSACLEVATKKVLADGVAEEGAETVAKGGLPWWVSALVALAVAQTAAFVWLCCRLHAARRRRRLATNSTAGGGKLSFVSTTDASLASPRSLCSGGLISAYAPASALAGPRGATAATMKIISSATTTTSTGCWTMGDSSSGESSSNRCSPSSSTTDAASSPEHASATRAFGFGLPRMAPQPLRRAASICGDVGGDNHGYCDNNDIHIQLEGSAVGAMTLPPPASSLYYHHQPPPAMSTFRR